MYNRKEIKKQAKHSLKTNYWRTVFIGILLVITITSKFNSKLVETSSLYVTGATDYSNWEAILNIIRFYSPEFLTGDVPWKILLSNIFGYIVNILTNTISYPLYLVSSIFSSGFTSSMDVFYALVGFLFYSVLIAFFTHPLHIGARRYFLLKSRNKDEKNPILYPFSRFYLNIVITKVLKSILYYLWCLTIVGGFIKYYSYSVVDYILEDNPSMSPMEVIKLSEKLTKGHKMELFRLDLSFLGYQFLSVFTFGLLDYLFLTPYKELALCEYYNRLKADLIAADPTALTDYTTTIERNQEGLILRREVDYNPPYQISDYILMFFVVCFIGWLWECIFHFIQFHEITNRGTLWGPWLPIYGSGAVLVMVLLRNTRNKPWLTFLLAMVICLTIEYLTGWYFDKVKGVRYWDYTTYPLNLNGYICLYGGLMFGAGCIMMIYFLGPALYALFSKIPSKPKWIVSSVLIIAFITDVIVSQFYKNPGGIDKSSIVEGVERFVTSLTI